jgi:hypothetical protein
VASQEPANPKLWQMIIIQAKAKFATYPSPGASHWVHEQYVQHGGRFVESSAATKRRKELIKNYKKKILDKRANSKDEKGKEKNNDEKK